MAIPSSYTETTLADYMMDQLKGIATMLGWTTTPDDYQEAVNEALLSYGADDIATIMGRDNLRKLRALAKIEVWKAALAAVTLDFDFSADGGSYSRDQVFQHIKDALNQSLTDGLVFMPEYAAEIEEIEFGRDPYVVRDEDYYDL
jgi:hypothetical protein